MADDLDRLSAALADRYTLERELGAGGMATVHLARDRKHHRLVAVKVLRPELSAVLGAERFLREIQIAAGLAHPHILPVHDSGQADGFLYYVMPYVEGGSLRRLLVREHRLPLERAIEVCDRVADALDYAHRCGIVHRDIKPENILFAEGHPVVADFGIAKALSHATDEPLTRTGFPLGTVGYMSPEQAAGGTDLDATTDTFSLGCTFYEMVVGEPPGRWFVEDPTRPERLDPLPTAHRARLDGLPAHVETALAAALHMAPSRRPQSPREFVDGLRRAKSKRRYDSAEVKEIVRRAAELEVERPTETGALTMGAVRRIAADAGIPTELVRQAARELDTPSGTAASGMLSLFIGGPTAVAASRVARGELPVSQHDALAREIQGHLGIRGGWNTLGRSLTWHARHPDRLAATGKSAADWMAEWWESDNPEIRVRVAAREGRTEILAEQQMGPLAGGLYGGVVGGIGGSAAITGFVLTLTEVLSATTAGLGTALVAGVSYGIIRTVFPWYARKRQRELGRLVETIGDQVEELAGEEGVAPEKLVPSKP